MGITTAPTSDFPGADLFAIGDIVSASHDRIEKERETLEEAIVIHIAIAARTQFPTARTLTLGEHPDQVDRVLGVTEILDADGKDLREDDDDDLVDLWPDVEEAFEETTEIQYWSHRLEKYSTNSNVGTEPRGSFVWAVDIDSVLAGTPATKVG